MEAKFNALSGFYNKYNVETEEQMDAHEKEEMKENESKWKIHEKRA